MSVALSVNSAAVEEELKKRKNMALFAIGSVVLENAVEAISGTYDIGMKAVDTGRLRASLSFVTPQGQGGANLIPSSKSEDGDWLDYKSEADTVVIGTNVRYAEFVHNGTIFMGARPFLLDGVNRSYERINELLPMIFGDEEYNLNVSTEQMERIEDSAIMAATDFIFGGNKS